MIAEMMQDTATATSPLKFNRRTPEERDQIIESMLPLIRHIAGRLAIYLPPYISMEDLYSAGVIGLIDAVDRYNPEKNCSLKTYCTLRIRGSILDELRTLDWIPRSIHRDSRKLMTAQETVAQRLGREPLEEEIQTELGLSNEEFNDLLERTKPAHFFSLQDSAPCSDDVEPLLNEEIYSNPDEILSDGEILKKEDKKILDEQMKKLPLQQIQVLSLHYMEGLRLKEISEILDLTQARVSQIHTLAIQRLKSAFERSRRL